MNKRLVLFSHKISLLLLLSCCVFLSQAQNKDSSARKYSADVMFTYKTVFSDNSEMNLVISPTFQYYISLFSLYFGPSIMLSFHDSTYKNKYGYKIGFTVCLPNKKNHKLNGYFRTEYNYIRLWGENISYDYAVPSIAIPIHVRVKKMNYDLSVRIGANYRFSKRLYLGADIGPSFMFWKDYGYYNKGATIYPTTKFEMALTYCIQMGVNF